MKRYATANWKGSGKEGKGTLTSESSLFNNAPYAYNTRFENEPGTNPEELVAAAHAGCFSMKLSFILGNAGFTPDSIETRCEITLDPAKGVVLSHLIVKSKVPGISKEKYEECVADAKANCPISKLLNCEITAESSLI